MKHSGTELKKRKRTNPYPKRPESEIEHYRDIVKQKEWLRSNMFDSLGNYLYCSNCIKSSLNDRLAHQRKIKRNECQNPIREATKLEVEEQRLSEYVIMPTDVQSSFKQWWRSFSPSLIVEVRYPHERHENALKFFEKRR